MVYLKSSNVFYHSHDLCYIVFWKWNLERKQVWILNNLYEYKTPFKIYPESGERFIVRLFFYYFSRFF
jgi:hypothetical protein